jgi:hypothetical protein
MDSEKEETILKLIRFSHNYENHFPNVNHYDLAQYYNKLVDEDKIIVEWDSDRDVVGYVEYFRLNYAQFGWMICNGTIDIFKHSISGGNIAYLANILIRPMERKTRVIRKLKKRFFELNRDADFITGSKNGKRYKPIAVFKNKGVRS